ncbi:unnamed protein product [Rotaria sp. Silwood1]|nr:unnamed protein product [Rotaria sp. Silwood1]
MIGLPDLSLDESLDSTTSNTDRSFSIISSSLRQYSSSHVKYNPSNIQILLKEQPEKYVLVDNYKVNHAKLSSCWNRFPLPSVKDENNRNIVIKNFATYRSCYATYAFTYGSTKSLNSHKCVKESSSISTSPSPKSPSLNSKITPRRSRISFACRLISLVIVDLDGNISLPFILLNGPNRKKIE